MQAYVVGHPASSNNQERCVECDYYFAYGSNMNPARMAVRGMRYRQSLRAQLPGWQLAFNKRAHGKEGIAYASIVKAKPCSTSPPKRYSVRTARNVVPVVITVRASV